MLRSWLLVALLVGLGSSPAWALDSIRKSAGQNVSGTIKSITKNEIEIDKTSGGSEKVPILDIETVRFDGEPPQLAAVRSLVSNGSFDDALKQLTKIDAAGVTRPETQKELQYYKLYAAARLALAGSGDVGASGKALNDWLTANPNNYHYYQGTELVADLLVKAGTYDVATTFYAKLEEAVAPELKMRAGVGTGRSLLAQKKYPEAQVAFDKVLAQTTAKGRLADQQRFAASLGKSTCVSESGNPDQAIKTVEEVIKGVNPEDTDLMAQAYVTLGKAHLINAKTKPEAKKDALLAFLHVDTLYSGNAQAHAEALRQLDPLWRDLGKPERALQAVQLLKDRYSAGQ